MQQSFDMSNCIDDIEDFINYPKSFLFSLLQGFIKIFNLSTKDYYTEKIYNKITLIKITEF